MEVTLILTAGFGSYEVEPGVFAVGDWETPRIPKALRGKKVKSIKFFCPCELCPNPYCNGHRTRWTKERQKNWSKALKGE